MLNILKCGYDSFYAHAYGNHPFLKHTMNYLFLLDFVILFPIYLAELFILSVIFMRIYTWIRHRYLKGRSLSFFHPHW